MKLFIFQYIYGYSHETLYISIYLWLFTWNFLYLNISMIIHIILFIFEYIYDNPHETLYISIYLWLFTLNFLYFNISMVIHIKLFIFQYNIYGSPYDANILYTVGYQTEILFDIFLLESRIFTYFYDASPMSTYRCMLRPTWMISALQHKSKYKSNSNSNFLGKKINFFGSHVVVLVKTFPLTYQLLM